MTALLIFTINLAIVIAALALVDRHVSRSTTADDEDARLVEFAEFGPVHKSVDNS